MNRRKFLQFLGAGAAATAAGLMVPDVARKIFLPPNSGWADFKRYSMSDLQVGDVVTVEGVHDPLKIRKCKQFIITDIHDERILIQDVRYDAVWTLPSGEEKQFGVQFESSLNSLDDRVARELLENRMRADGGTPGGTYFKLELPTNQLAYAKYI